MAVVILVLAVVQGRAAEPLEQQLVMVVVEVVAVEDLVEVVVDQMINELVVVVVVVVAVVQFVSYGQDHRDNSQAPV